MRRLIYVFVILCIVGCVQSNEDKIRTAFSEYVKNNFDDPSQFKEIVSIDSLDTISTIKIKELFNELIITRKRTYEIGDSIEKINFKYINDDKLKSQLGQSSEFMALAQKVIELNEYYIYLSDKNLSMIDAEAEWKEIQSHKDTVFYNQRLTYRVNYNDGLKLKTCFVYFDTLYNNITFRDNRIKAYEASEITKEIDEFDEKYEPLFELNSERVKTAIQMHNVLRRMFGDIY